MSQTETSNNPYVKQRIENIKLMLQKIRDSPDKPIDQIVAEISLETGATSKRAREYLQTLIDGKKVKLHDKGLQQYVTVEE